MNARSRCSLSLRQDIPGKSSVAGWEGASSASASDVQGGVDSVGSKRQLLPGGSPGLIVQNDVTVIQHQDSGPAQVQETQVQEVPPPYNFDTVASTSSTKAST